MTRRIFPNEEDRLVYGYTNAGSPLLDKAGASISVFIDSAGAFPADILTEAGASVPGGVLTVDAESKIPRFQGPDGSPYGVDTLYYQVQGSSNILAIHSRYDDRLDILEQGFANTAVVTDNYSIAANVQCVIFQGGTSKTITFPVANGNGRRLIVLNDSVNDLVIGCPLGSNFLRTGPSGNNITIIGGGVVEAISDGTNWWFQKISGARFTPTWTTSGTQPAIGNGSLKGVYHFNGERVRFWISMLAGSTTTFGTGAWAFGLGSGYPDQGFVSGSGTLVGQCTLLDNSAASNPLDYVIFSNSSTNGLIPKKMSTNASIDNVTPWTWAVADRITLQGEYLSGLAGF